MSGQQRLPNMHAGTDTNRPGIDRYGWTETEQQVYAYLRSELEASRHGILYEQAKRVEAAVQTGKGPSRVAIAFQIIDARCADVSAEAWSNSPSPMWQFRLVDEGEDDRGEPEVAR